MCISSLHPAQNDMSHSLHCNADGSSAQTSHKSSSTAAGAAEAVIGALVPLEEEEEEEEEEVTVGGRGGCRGGSTTGRGALPGTATVDKDAGCVGATVCVAVTGAGRDARGFDGVAVVVIAATAGPMDRSL